MVAQDEAGAADGHRCGEHRRQHGLDPERPGHLLEGEQGATDRRVERDSQSRPPSAVCIILTSWSGGRALRAAWAPIAAPM